MKSILRIILGDRPVRRFFPYVFGFLVVSLTLHPYVLQATLHSVWLPYVEGAMNLFIVSLGVLIYYLYERERHTSESRFLETSKYIGVVNRKLPLLQNITTDLLLERVATAKQKTKAFRDLLGIACGTIAKSERGLLRFVETDTGRTVKEFQYYLGDTQSGTAVTIGNKELLHRDSLRQRIAQAGNMHLVVATSDREATIRAFLVIPNARKDISENIPILQAIVDQGQILSGYVFRYYSKSYA